MNEDSKEDFAVVSVVFFKLLVADLCLEISFICELKSNKRSVFFEGSFVIS